MVSLNVNYRAYIDHQVVNWNVTFLLQLAEMIAPIQHTIYGKVSLKHLED